MFRGIRKTLVFVFCLQQSVFIKETLAVYIQKDEDVVNDNCSACLEPEDKDFQENIIIKKLVEI